MQNHRRSLLQKEILMVLASCDEFQTITQIALDVEAMRPAVSRSMKLLRKQHLIIKDDKYWRLTPEGEYEAGDWLDELMWKLNQFQLMMEEMGSVS